MPSSRRRPGPRCAGCGRSIAATDADAIDHRRCTSRTSLRAPAAHRSRQPTAPSPRRCLGTPSRHSLRHSRAGGNPSEFPKMPFQRLCSGRATPARLYLPSGKSHRPITRHNASRRDSTWIPASAGMTTVGEARAVHQMLGISPGKTKEKTVTVALSCQRPAVFHAPLERTAHLKSWRVAGKARSGLSGAFRDRGGTTLAPTAPRKIPARVAARNLCGPAPPRPPLGRERKTIGHRAIATRYSGATVARRKPRCLGTRSRHPLRHSRGPPYSTPVANVPHTSKPGASPESCVSGLSGAFRGRGGTALAPTAPRKIPARAAARNLCGPALPLPPLGRERKTICHRKIATRHSGAAVARRKPCGLGTPARHPLRHSRAGGNPSESPQMPVQRR